jgi:ABC transport system ATP-binding/permease protein
MSHCGACGAVIGDPALACPRCYASEAAFPWQHVGQTIVIGAAHDSRGPCLVIGCGADDGDPARLGCARGFHHAEDDFIARCDDGVSRRHASITPQRDGSFHVVNLSQTNRTRVDLDEVPGDGLRAMPGQRVSVGQWDFVLGAAWPPRGFRRGTWRLPVEHLTVAARGKLILDDVSLVVERSELVGLLGPSGAGKTTLLYALARIKAARGAAQNDDLARFWGSLGYVPQDDIVHADLTVEQALRYACRLRLPAGTREDAIRQRVRWAIARVGLQGKERTRIGNPDDKTLSGGERRRVSLAAALVTRPKILILDEPTSGLSWTDAARVLDCLRDLAESRSEPGRTIIVTIHQPDVREFEKFHQVAILARGADRSGGGRLVFFGPPQASYGFFAAPAGRPPDVFAQIDGSHADVDAIAERFAASPLHATFVAARLQRDLSSDAQRRGDPPVRPSALRQFATLFARRCRLRVSQRRGLALLFAIAAVLGGLSRLGKGEVAYPPASFGCKLRHANEPAPFDDCAAEPAPREACSAAVPGAPVPAATAALSAATAPPREPPALIPELRSGLLSMLMAVVLPLLVVAAGALVSERTIARNEAIAGVRTGPYLAARFLELFLVGVGFMAVVVAIAAGGLDVAADLASLLQIGIAGVASAVSLGLLISALVPRAELALWAVNLIAVPQLLFAGVLMPLRGGIDLVSHLTVTRPALEAMVKLDLLHRAGLRGCQIQRYLRALPGYSTEILHPVRAAAASLVPFAAICLVAAYAALRIRSWRERRF